MREGKTPIARCSDKDKFQTIAEIDTPGTRVIVNPGGTNERFARGHVRNAEIKVHNDNVTIFDEIAKGNADLMITDSSETQYQQKLFVAPSFETMADDVQRWLSRVWAPSLAVTAGRLVIDAAKEGSVLTLTTLHPGSERPAKLTLEI